MKINRFFCRSLFLCLLAGSLLFTVGCASSKPGTGKFSEEEMAVFPLAKKQGLPGISGGLVLSIGSETITVDQIVSAVVRMLKEEVNMGDFGQFRQQVGPAVSQLIRSKITDILLYEEAKRSVSDGMNEYLDKAVESEVNRFMADYDGNVAKAQEAIEAMGFDWQGFRDYQKKLILVQSYIQQKMTDGAPVTHGELLDHYNANKAERFGWEGTVEFSLIDIQPDKLDLSEDTEISSKEAALKFAGELSERINEGQDFSEVAKEHSHGHRRAMGGRWEPVTIGSLAKAYEILEAESQKLQPGEVSDPIEAEGHVFIIKLKRKTPGGYKSFEEVQDEIEAEVVVERRVRQYEEMVSKLISQANISKLNEFLEYCIETAYRRRLSGR